MAEPNGRGAAGRARVDLAPWQFDRYVLARSGRSRDARTARSPRSRSAPGGGVSLQAMVRDAEDNLRERAVAHGRGTRPSRGRPRSEVRQLKAALAPELPPGRSRSREPGAAPLDHGRPGRPGVTAAPGVVGTGTGRRLGRRAARAGRSGRGSRRRCSRPRARPSRVGAHTPRCRCRVASTPTRSRSRSATCWAGWSPPAPIRSVTTSARACAGWARSRSGRSSSPHAARWFRSSGGARAGVRARTTANGSFSVRWTPALVERARLERMAETMPGSVRVLDRKVDARALTRSALTGMVDAICRNGARRLEVPAPPPRVRTANDVAEAFLARLDGSAFDAPVKIAGEIVTRIERWAKLVTEPHERLIVQLDPPDEGGAWHLAVNVRGPRGGIISVEQAIAAATTDRAAPRRRDGPPRAHAAGVVAARRAAARAGHSQRRRSLGPDGDDRPALVAAGFDVRAPQISLNAGRAIVARLRRRRRGNDRRRQPTCERPLVGGVRRRRAHRSRHRATREGSAPAHSSARPLGRDRQVDLEAAAEALAQRRTRQQLSGAEMLRLALGLDDSPLAGRVSIEGGGWASDLLAAADTVKTAPARTPQRVRRRAAELSEPKRSPGSASSIPSGSADVSRSTWVSARRRRCSRICSRTRRTGRRW